MSIIRLIGAPTDVGAGHRGTSMGPEALRVAGIVEALRGRGFEVEDYGNLTGPQNSWQPPVKGYRHLAEVAAWNRTVFDAFVAALNDDRLPILLGGDHSLGIGSITAVSRWCSERKKKLLVLWLDAHADFNTFTITPSGNIHGMPTACLCGIGPYELTHLAGNAPALRADQIRQIGVRSVDEGERKLVHMQGLDIYDMRYIDEIGIKRAMEEALTDIDADTHLHVSFDVDFLDPDIAPGVGTTVRGGPNYREAQLVMELIADTGRMGSLDVVELNPAFDEHNRTAQLVVDLVESLFGKTTLMRA